MATSGSSTAILFDQSQKIGLSVEVQSLDMTQVPMMQPSLNQDYLVIRSRFIQTNIGLISHLYNMNLNLLKLVALARALRPRGATRCVCRLTATKMCTYGNL
jgi:hypothetical protein